jgi:hypothetical protein
MKIYIAGPMTGYPDFNYPAFDAAFVELRKKGYEAISPAVWDTTDPKKIKPWEFYTRAGLELMLKADAVATLKGWDESKGAGLEVYVARALEMPVKPLEDWLGLEVCEYCNARITLKGVYTWVDPEGDEFCDDTTYGIQTVHKPRRPA